MLQLMNRQRQAEKYFTLICAEEEKEEKWMLNAKIIPFSDYLSHFDEEPQVGQENNLFTFPIPLTYVDSQIIELTNLFYEMHKYNKESIKISKINIRGLKHSIDNISLQYTRLHLKDKGEQVYKKLLNFCEFLKLNGLKDLICVYIASKYDFTFDEKKLQRQVERKGIEFSKQMQINLKKQLFTYSKMLGLELLDKYREKVQKEKDKYF